MSGPETPIENSTVARLQAMLLKRSDFSKVTEFVVFLLIFSMSVFGNAVLCVSLVRKSQFRNTTEYYIVSLSAVSLLMVVLCSTPSVVTSFTSRWIFGQVICEVQAFLTEILAVSTVHHLAIIAINRYVKVCRTQSVYNKLFSNRRTLLSIGFIWLLSIGSVLLRLCFVYVQPSFHPGTLFCFSQPLSQTAGPGLAAVAILMHILYPLFSVVFCYFKVFQATRSHIQNLSESMRQNANEIKISKVLFVTVLAFCFCWSPVFIIRVIQIFGKDEFPRYAYLIYTLMGLGYNAVNPVIFGVMSRTYRDKMLQCIKCA